MKPTLVFVRPLMIGALLAALAALALGTALVFATRQAVARVIGQPYA